MLSILLALVCASDPNLHDVVPPKVKNAVILSDPARVTLAGPLADRYSLIARDRLRSIDEDELLAGFEKRPGAQAWIGEHVGKWLHAAAIVQAATNDEELGKKIDRVRERLLATQQDDGYLGTYLPERRFGLFDGADWDVWIHKYDLLGLIADWRYRDSFPALMAARRAGDVLCSTFGEGGKDLVAAGTHAGMAATSVLEPMVLLYRITDEPRYRTFCERLIARLGEPGGPNLVNDLAGGKPVSAVANGKAYEMLSNLVGLCEAYRQFGDAKLLTAVENAWNDVVSTQLYPTGTASTGEFWQREAKWACDADAHLGETCVTVTWSQFNLQLYSLIGDVKYLEEYERTIYNHLLAAQRGHGSDWCYFTPLVGTKEFRSDMNCCHSSGPRALAVLPTIAVTQTNDVIRVNLYDFAHAELEIKGNQITVERSGDPWSREGCTIRVTPRLPGEFEVALHRPRYALAFECESGGEALSESAPGFVSLRRDFGKAGTPTVIHVRGLGTLNEIDGGKYGRPGEVALQFGPFVLAPDSRFQAPPGLTTRTARLITTDDPQRGKRWNVSIDAFADAKGFEIPTFASVEDDFRVFVPREK